MSRVGRPARADAQGRVARIGEAVRDVAGDIVEAAGLHRLEPALAAFIHEDERARALNAPVIFAAFPPRVIMSLGHEVFAADLTGHDVARAEEQTAGRSVFDRHMALNFIDDGCRVHLGAGGFVPKHVFEVAECPFGFADIVTAQVAAEQVNHRSVHGEFFLLCLYCFCIVLRCHAEGFASAEATKGQ